MGLIEDAVMAKQLGYTSYGQYMQTKGTPPPLKRHVLDINCCQVCGKELPTNNGKYCSYTCALESKRRKRAGIFV